jgi:cellobiose-specific phosphotransferase system component IIB
MIEILFEKMASIIEEIDNVIEMCKIVGINGAIIDFTDFDIDEEQEMLLSYQIGMLVNEVQKKSNQLGIDFNDINSLLYASFRSSLNKFILQQYSDISETDTVIYLNAIHKSDKRIESIRSELIEKLQPKK